jgi:Leucine rich repeat
MTTSSYGGSRSGPIQGIQLPENVPLDTDLAAVGMNDPIEFLSNTEGHVTIRVEDNQAMMHISDPAMRRYKLDAVDSDGSSRLYTVTPHGSRRCISSNDPASISNAASSSRPSTLTDTTQPPSSRNNWETNEVIQPPSAQAASAGRDNEQGVDRSNGAGTKDKTQSLTLLVERSGGFRWFALGVLGLLLLAGGAIAGIICGAGGCSSPDTTGSPTSVPTTGSSEPTFTTTSRNPTMPPTGAPAEPISESPITTPPISTPLPTFSSTSTEAITERPITAPPITTPVPISPSTSTVSPTLPVTLGPTFIVPGLSPETLAKQNDFTTPQGLALLFVESYPGFAQLPDWRKRQIFSMATFFRSFNGPAWPLSRRFQWLESGVHECDWASVQTQSCDMNQEMEFLGLLSDPDLTGSMPPEVGLLTQLEELSVINCGLVGNATTVLPDELTSLTNLRLFSVEGNALTGEVPTVLTSFTNLQYLGLQDNQWTGTVPADWANLSNLRSLDLSNTSLTGSIPEAFVYFENLEDLLIVGTQLVIPTELCDSPSLIISADCGTIECCQ